MFLCIVSVINNQMVNGEEVGEWIFRTSAHLLNKSKNILRTTTTVQQFTLKFKKTLKVSETSYVNNNSIRLHWGMYSSDDVTKVQFRACGRYCPLASGSTSCLWESFDLQKVIKLKINYYHPCLRVGLCCLVELVLGRSEHIHNRLSDAKGQTTVN